LGKELGSGNYGIVREATKLGLSSDHKFAVKIINRERSQKTKMHELEVELKNLMALDHINIIKIIEIIVDYDFFYIVTEFLQGGELYDRIHEERKFSEEEAVQVISQLLSAIKHLHEKNICHRDLKPENILYEQKESKIVKIIDFGLSKKLEGNSLNSLIGTPLYMAPEVINGKYDLACDMWSIGVITYQLLTK